jgi:hypothetical protein
VGIDIGLAHPAHGGTAEQPLQFKRAGAPTGDVIVKSGKRLRFRIVKYAEVARGARPGQARGRVEIHDEVDLRREGVHAGDVLDVLGHHALPAAAVGEALVEQVHGVARVGPRRSTRGKRGRQRSRPQP